MAYSNCFNWNYVLHAVARQQCNTRTHTHQHPTPPQTYYCLLYINTHRIIVIKTFICYQHRCYRCFCYWWEFEHLRLRPNERNSRHLSHTKHTWLSIESMHVCRERNCEITKGVQCKTQCGAEQNSTEHRGKTENNRAMQKHIVMIWSERKISYTDTIAVVLAMIFFPVDDDKHQPKYTMTFCACNLFCKKELFFFCSTVCFYLAFHSCPLFYFVGSSCCCTFTTVYTVRLMMMLFSHYQITRVWCNKFLQIHIPQNWRWNRCIRLIWSQSKFIQNLM